MKRFTAMSTPIRNPTAGTALRSWPGVLYDVDAIENGRCSRRRRVTAVDERFLENPGGAVGMLV
jgi:hypothetical protein